MWLSCNKPSYANTYSPKEITLSVENASPDDRDTIMTFRPKFDSAGLVTAIAIDNSTKDVLMVAHMNAAAIAETQKGGIAHFWSRSREVLWMKGETSGNTLRVSEIRVDCDQDALLLFVDPAGPACHTGERSCFYRIVDDNSLVKVKS